MTLVLHSLGYRYGRVKRYKLSLTDERVRKMQNFMVQYDKFLKLQDAGTHVLCYMDESYVHVNHATNFTWVKQGVRCIEGNPGKGFYSTTLVPTNHLNF
jgi:hypothetical protein